MLRLCRCHLFYLFFLPLFIFLFSNVLRLLRVHCNRSLLLRPFFFFFFWNCYVWLQKNKCKVNIKSEHLPKPFSQLVYPISILLSQHLRKFSRNYNLHHTCVSIDFLPLYTCAFLNIIPTYQRQVYLLKCSWLSSNFF